MIPDAAETVRRRVAATLAIRVLCFPFLMIALVPFGIWISEGIVDGDLFVPRYFLGPVIFGSLGLLVTGAFFLASGGLAKLLVKPATYNQCPRCGYRLEGLVEPVCSECGLPLTREFMGEPRPAVPADTPELCRARMVTLFTPILRLAAGVGAFASGSLASLIFLLMLVNDFDEEPLAVTVVLFFGMCFLVLVFFGGRRITEFMVPRVAGWPTVPAGEEAPAVKSDPGDPQ